MTSTVRKVKAKMPLWIDALVRFWPVLVGAASLVTVAIARDLNNEIVNNQQEKYGTAHERESVDELRKILDVAVSTQARLVQHIEDVDHRIDRLEDARSQQVGPTKSR